MAISKLNSTKREIHATLEIMKSWDMMENLTKSEKERIENQLKQIASSAINDYKNSVSVIGTELYNEILN